MGKTCVNGFRHAPGTRAPGRCWACEQRAREAACAHDGERIPHWAGILGFRYDCAKCGAFMGGDDGRTAHG